MRECTGQRGIGAAMAALLLAACGNSDPVPAAAPAGEVTSPSWQAAMTRHQLEGHPDWPDVIQLDGSVDTQIWPGLEYWVYVPPAAASKASPPLVVYLHGSSQNALDAARGVRWNEVADRVGTIVVYPQGPGDTWSWGQSTAYGRGAGELEAVARITREVQRDFGADPRRTYVSGASSGGITATMLGALYADHYTAVAPIIACSYNCSDPLGLQAYAAMGANAKVVPAFLVHGTLDHLFPVPVAEQADSQWTRTNDLADDGMPNGSISPVPEIDLSHMEGEPGGSGEPCPLENNNPCLGPLLGLATYPYQIHRYRDGAGRTIVESWYIHGLAHNYPYGVLGERFTDPTGPDVTSAAYAFFESVGALEPVPVR